MKLRLLPNYFKKIGLALFILTVWPNFIHGFIEGYNNSSEEGQIAQFPEFTFWGITFFSESFYDVFAILSVIGLIIYALSRDKVLDELLLKLRMEAVHLTFFLSMALILALLLLGIKSEMSAIYVLELQVIIFLVIKKMKKFSFKPNVPKNHE